MTNKKKTIIIFVSLLLFVSITSIWLFVLFTSDISDEKLGPSPFKVADSFADDNNAEFQEILRIGATVIDIRDTFRNFDRESLQEYASRLKIILQKNQQAIDQSKPELFLKCKFPDQKMDINYLPLLNLFRLYEKKITYEILINDFENAKNDLIISDQINNNLIEKCTNPILFVLIKINKFQVLDNVKLLINQETPTIRQKISILDIKPGRISNQVFIPIAHYGENLIKYKMKITPSINIDDNASLPFVNSYMLQPNRSVKYYRNIFTKTIAELNKPTFNLNTDLEKIITWDSSLGKFYTPNSNGNKIIYKDIAAYEEIFKDVLVYNNYCNLLTLTKELLVYKEKYGHLPSTLSDLNLDKKLNTDILTDAPFLYSAENGILQSVGKNKINDCVDLTTKKLTPSEIRKFLNDEDFHGDFIIYLK